MRANLTLLHKALILVAVPLAFEIIFVLVLGNLLNQAEQAREREEHARNIASHLNAMLRYSLDYTLRGVLVSVEKSVNYVDLETPLMVKKEIRALTGELQTLKELTANFPDEKQSIEELATMQLNMGLLWNKFRQYADNHENMAALKALIETRKAHEKIFAVVDRLIAEQQSVEQSKLESQAIYRGQIQQLLGLGVAFNVLLAISLALYFNRGTAMRLQILVDNSRRLAAGVPLNPRMDGADEIANLDKTFNEMALALRAAARQEQAIIDNAQDVICSMDQSGILTRVSPAAERMWGYKPKELQGRNYLSLVDESDVDQTKRAILDLKKGTSSAPIENRMVKHDGSTIDMLFSARWSPEDQRFFCVAHDITQRKHAERMRQEFLSMVSHDLRSPLTSVQAFLELLSVGACGTLNEKGKGKLANADRNVMQMLNLIRDLLDSERARAGEMVLEARPVALADLIERSIEAVRIQSEQLGIGVVVHENPDVQVLADSDRLTQVIVNLLSNALKFSPPGSEVRITSSIGEEWAEVRVSDTGRGIAAAHQKSIFERYMQVEKNDAVMKGGAGLGLAICKSIIERHNGAIGVESEEGKGSTFWFRVPLYKGV